MPYLSYKQPNPLVASTSEVIDPTCKFLQTGSVFALDPLLGYLVAICGIPAAAILSPTGNPRVIFDPRPLGTFAGDAFIPLDENQRWGAIEPQLDGTVAIRV
jgi:hypothetical protein